MWTALEGKRVRERKKRSQRADEQNRAAFLEQQLCWDFENKLF